MKHLAAKDCHVFQEPLIVQNLSAAINWRVRLFYKVFVLCCMKAYVLYSRVINEAVFRQWS